MSLHSLVEKVFSSVKWTILDFLGVYSLDSSGIKAMVSLLKLSFITEEDVSCIYRDHRYALPHLAQYAACSEHEELFGIIVRHNDVYALNTVDEHDHSPLMWTSACGHIDMSRMLLMKGAFVDLVNSHGQTALFLAVRNDHVPIAALLVEDYHSNVGHMDERGWTPFLLACHSGVSHAMLRLLHSHDTSCIHACTKDGSTCLHIAVSNNHVHIIEILVNEFHVNVNATNKDGVTSLMWAAVSAPATREVTDTNTDVRGLDILLRADADRLATDKDGMTAFMYAAQEHSAAAMAMLQQS
jgi:ankyrin repeat protein